MLQTAKIPGASGKACMKLYRNVLFIGRDKDVNLYDVKTKKFIGEIKGPGGGILCLEIVRNQVRISNISIYRCQLFDGLHKSVNLTICRRTFFL